MHCVVGRPWDKRGTRQPKPGQTADRGRRDRYVRSIKEYKKYLNENINNCRVK